MREREREGETDKQLCVRFLGRKHLQEFARRRMGFRRVCGGAIE